MNDDVVYINNEMMRCSDDFFPSAKLKTTFSISFNNHLKYEELIIYNVSTASQMFTEYYRDCENNSCKITFISTFCIPVDMDGSKCSFSYIDNKLRFIANYFDFDIYFDNEFICIYHSQGNTINMTSNDDTQRARTNQSQ